MIIDSHFLRTDYRTLFRLRPDGRIERENDPDGSEGPRFWFAGCPEGNVFGLRADLPDDLAARLEDLAFAEPRLVHPATPQHLDRYLSLLGVDGAAAYYLGLIYELPHAHPYPGGIRLITSDTSDGHALVRSWAGAGMPAGLVELGFRTLADLWAPWCVAVIDGEVASIAFAARLADDGAELGVVTVKTFRGQGLAAAVTAGWSRIPALRSRTLFYSTTFDNASSQRVAARLDLPLRGTSLRIP